MVNLREDMVIFFRALVDLIRLQKIVSLCRIFHETFYTAFVFWVAILSTPEPTEIEQMRFMIDYCC